MFKLPDFNEFHFIEDALELFKRIWLSCVYNERVLASCVEFLKLKVPATLADTYKYVNTGSCTIGCYKAFSGSTNNQITKEDVIMAFAGELHIEAMKESYIYGDGNDFWHENFKLEPYLISHVVKPVVIDVMDLSCMKLISNTYHDKLFLKNPYCPNEFNNQLVHLVHFGVIVDSLDCTIKQGQIIFKNLLDLQKEIFDDFDQFINFKKTNIDYNFLDEIYKRNYGFYSSLKI